MLRSFLTGLSGLFTTVVNSLNIMDPQQRLATGTYSGFLAATLTAPTGTSHGRSTNAATLAPQTPTMPATTPSRPTAPNATPIDNTDPERARDVLAPRNFCCGQRNQVEPFDGRMRDLYGGRNLSPEWNAQQARWTKVRSLYNTLYQNGAGQQNASIPDLRRLDDLMRRVYGPAHSA